MNEQIARWSGSVRKQPGPKFLESGFAELLQALTGSPVPAQDAAENFLTVAEGLGHEVMRTVDSLRRCEWIVDKWATGPARRCEDFRNAERPFARMEEEARAFQLTSERWGRYLRRHGELGAYRVKQDDSRPPYYRFVVELRPPWRAYANRCITAFGELIASYRRQGFSIPQFSPKVSEAWRTGLARREFGVGRGAFIATLETGLDELALAEALAATGFPLDERGQTAPTR